MYKILLFLFALILQFSCFSNSLLPPVYEAQSNECLKKCETPFGKKIGISYNTNAYSNCSSNCIFRPGFSYKKEKTNYIKDVWIGLPWQCVEYIRRWVLFNQQIEFEDVDFAYEIWQRSNALNLKSGIKYKYSNIYNGNNELPKFGDILVYDKSKLFPYGHVAIIVNIDNRKKFIDVAEENFQNKMWEDFHSYSRRIKVNYINKKFFITDQNYYTNNKYTLDDPVILGWKRLTNIKLED